mmetsp:Transcript_47920/g.103802  ORF Transcript_47920/g.103802 Transcript_47920/m.103802 type:complete len:202 (-) Transcript_47920:119-724(-)
MLAECARQYCSSSMALSCFSPATFKKRWMSHIFKLPAESPVYKKELVASVANATTDSPFPWRACCSHARTPSFTFQKRMYPSAPTAQSACDRLSKKRSCQIARWSISSSLKLGIASVNLAIPESRFQTKMRPSYPEVASRLGDEKAIDMMSSVWPASFRSASTETAVELESSRHTSTFRLQPPATISLFWPSKMNSTDETS